VSTWSLNDHNRLRPDVDWGDNVEIIAFAISFMVPLTILLIFSPTEVAEPCLGIAKKLLARLFRRPHRDDARQENPNALIREDDRGLTGREIYREVAAKNAVEYAADMKAWNEKRSDFPN
jgi:predicted phosphatase